MIADDDEHHCTNHFFALQKVIANSIVYHISYKCAIMSEITLNITLQGSCSIRLLRLFIP